MPEADNTRKRSRSPSDALNDQQKQYKRANTGAPSSSDDSHYGSSRATAHPGDIDMKHIPADTAASTPSPTDRSAPDMVSSEVKREDTGSATTSAAPSNSSAPTASPAANIHMRCLIVTQDASIIIGKGGSHVNEIREKSGARVMVSESIPGNPERILNVSGPLDAVSKVRCDCRVNLRDFTHDNQRRSDSLYGESTTSLSTRPPFLAAGQSPSNS